MRKKVCERCGHPLDDHEWNEEKKRFVCHCGCQLQGAGGMKIQ